MKRLIFICLMLSAALSLAAQATYSDVLTEVSSLIDEKRFDEAQSLLQRNEMMIKQSQAGMFKYNALMGMALLCQEKYAEAKLGYDVCRSEYAAGRAEADDIDTATLATVWYFAGRAYYGTNNVVPAEECYLRSLEIMERSGRKEEYESYPLLLADIGALYAGLNLYGKAYGYLQQAKQFYELGSDRCTKYANVLVYLATAYFGMDNLLSAKMHMDEALSLYEDIAEDEDPFIRHGALGGVSVSLLVAITIYNSLGLIDEAERAYSLASKIIQANLTGALQAENQAVADFLIAGAYICRAEYDKAKTYYRRAYKVMGNREINLISFLALANFATADPETRRSVLEYAESLVNNVAEKFSFLSAYDREGYWSMNYVNTQFLYYFLSHLQKPGSGAMYNTALFFKCLLLRTSTRIAERASADPALAAEAARLNNYYAHRAKVGLPQDTIWMINDSIAAIERRLAREVNGYTSPAKLKEEYNWKTVRNALGKDEAAIEFVAVRDTIYLGMNAPSEVDTRYYALVVRRGMNRPALVRLCADSALNNLLQRNIGLKLQRYIAQLYTQQGSPTRWLGNELYEMVWQPLEKHLRGVKRVYFSPVGRLNNLSFQAIGYNGKLVSDNVTLHQVSSTAEVAHMADRQVPELPRSSRVYGGIDYDTEDTVMIAEARGYEHNEARSSCRGSLSREPLSYLAASADEALYISDQLKSKGVAVELFTAGQANEESIKNMPADAHDLLHVATHGFYFRRGEPWRILGTDSTTTDIPAMDRTGLVFSGGNHAWRGDSVPDGIEDGILTAREISNLDLRGTRLVVLSACETGMGDILGDEGVFGLQRAFKLAGAQSVIMSLWKIDDEATNLFMRTFYDEYLGGTTIEEAFEAAIRSLRTRPEYKSPYYWGAFVLLD